MTKDELQRRKEDYLAKRTEIDDALVDIRMKYQNIFEEWQTAIKERQEESELLERIRSLAENLGTLPTLSKLREFLTTLREILKRQ